MLYIQAENEKRVSDMWLEFGRVLFRSYRPHHEDSIVDIRQREPSGKWRSLDNTEIHKYDNMSLVQVDLLEAISNDQYYIERVRDCEMKFDNQFSSQ